MVDRDNYYDHLLLELDYLRSEVSSFMETEPRRPGVDAVLRRIVEGTATATGGEFFSALVRALALVLNVRYAFVSEFAGSNSRVRTLAFWNGEGFSENFEYDITGTPCERVLRGETCHYPEGVQKLFPLATDLVGLAAEGYLAIPLTDKAGAVLGHLAILDVKSMSVVPHELSIVRIFSSWAAAELQLKRMETALKEREEQVQLLQRRHELSGNGSPNS